MPKAYVSSTYKDLQDYRRIVQIVLKRFGYEDVAMEYYVAEDRGPVDRCLADVETCDLYIGIFAWRYGWQPNGDLSKEILARHPPAPPTDPAVHSSDT